jgi:hypothetical protein
VGVLQPTSEPLDAVLGRQDPVGAGLGQCRSRFGSEEELAEELVLPDAQVEAAGDAVAAADDGLGFDGPEPRSDGGDQ